MTMTATYKKKLIEVALPLEAINVASAREKSIRHGHPSTLHLWWARRPLAAARAVIFAQMVDDPSAHPDIFKSEKAQEKERQRLFRIIEELVKWENTTNEKVLQQAREEIWQSWRYTCAENADHPRARELFDRYKLPAFHDPFAGGGALPLEAQRLGLESYASDLNPVAVLICKSMIEIPSKFAGCAPVNSHWQKQRDDEKAMSLWRGAQGLAEDVRYYGQWMRDEAEKRIGHLYPKVEVTAEMVKVRPDLRHYEGKKLMVIAWLWARTVKSPNPAFAQVDVPLVSTFMVSTKPGKESFVEPVVEGRDYRFTVKVGRPKNLEAAELGTKLTRGNFVCLMSGAPISGEYVRSEGKAARIGARLMAVVAQGDRRRIYLSPTAAIEAIARAAKPDWRPDLEFFPHALGFRVGNYGMTKWSDLYTSRQLVALTTFSDLVRGARERVMRDSLSVSCTNKLGRLEVEDSVSTAYADAVSVYLAFAVDKSAVYWNSLCPWLNQPKNEIVGNSFSRQTVQMLWDYAEANPFCDSGGNIEKQLEYVCMVLAANVTSAPGWALQADAAVQTLSRGRVISCDPPYFDNIGYADLSDFFYVWLRHSLKPAFPELFATLAVPKAEELVATPGRHGGKDGAERFFMHGMTQAMSGLASQAHPAFPVTIYYAFKQAESDGDAGNVSTGWETFLDAVISAGFSITGTWPMRTERPGRMRDFASNALASSIILVCRPRAIEAPTVTRREFVTALKAELPVALAHLQHSNIAPVDLAQAAIGPGMGVYTRYAKVLDAEGKPLYVREALALINQTLDDALAEQEGDFDADSRWALTWFEQSAFAEGEYGVAEQLSKSKNTSVAGMVEAGILESKRGKVRLLKPDELPANWNPATDTRLTAWEIVHQLIRALESGGEGAAAELVANLGPKAETARELCYRLYTLCERKKRPAEALAYNGLVQSWPEIARLAHEGGKPTIVQGALFGETEE
jgi:putative DNA methylase